MVKKTITFTDYNGVQRTEEHLFNLSKSELVEMELGTVGGFTAMINGIIAAQDMPSLVHYFKDIILRAYGVKSPDGKRLIKSKELSEAFYQTEAYTELFMELISNPDAAAKFMTGIIPGDVAKELPADATASLIANGTLPSAIAFDA